MSSRFVHRLLLHSRRALPSIRRSYYRAKLPPETSTAFSNTFSCSSGEPKDAGRRSRDEYIQSLVNNSRFPNLAEYWKKRIRLEKEGPILHEKSFKIDVVIHKIRDEMDKHSRSIQVLTDLEDEITGREDQSALIRQLSAMREEHWKIYLNMGWYDGYEVCKTVEDLEKWGDKCLEKLKEMNDSISEFNAGAKRIIASLPPPPQKEKKEKGIWPVMFSTPVFSNAFSSSSSSSTADPKDLAEEYEYWQKRLGLQKALQELVPKEKYERLEQLFDDLEDAEKYVDVHQIFQVWRFYGKCREQEKLQTEIVKEVWSFGSRDCKTVEDWEKIIAIWGDRRPEKLRELNDSISEINLYADRMIADQEEKKEMGTLGFWKLLFLLILLPAMFLD